MNDESCCLIHCPKKAGYLTLALFLKTDNRGDYIVMAWGIRLQSKFQNHFNQLVLGYHIVVIRIELLEYIAAKI